MEYVDFAGSLPHVFTVLLRDHKFPGVLLIFIMFFVLFRMFSWIGEIYEMRKVRLLFTVRLFVITCCAWLCCDVDFK